MTTKKQGGEWTPGPWEVEEHLDLDDPFRGEWTPGPWEVEEHLDLAEAQEAGAFGWTHLDDDPFRGGPLGTVWRSTSNGGSTGLPGSVEVSLANAYLIAAAPTMAREIEHAIAWLEDLELSGEVPDSPRAAGFHMTLSGLRAALVAAKGGGHE